MFFLRYDRDPFDTVHRTLHPFDETMVSSSRWLRVDRNFTKTFRVGQRLGLFNEHNLGWIGLENDELDFIESVNGVSSATLLERYPEPVRDTVRNLLLALFARGLVTFDGQPYVRNQIFDDGPLYHHSYLIELLLTERCNLRCSYCFAEVANNKKFMTEDTAEVVLAKVLEIPTKRLMVEFSGGEVFLNFPTFKFCVEYLTKHGQDRQIQFSTQTNALLLNEEILLFCAEHQVHLSLTLDGPKDIHDRQRIHIGGKGSYDKVINAIRLLQQKSIPFGVIGVITSHSVGHAAEIMQHYHDLGIRHVKLNHCTPQGYSREVWDEIGIDGAAYLRFMTEVYDWMKENDGAVTESNLEVFFLNMISRTSEYRCTRTACRAGSEFLVFDPEGGVFPCPRFKHNPETLLGNIHSTNGRVDQLYQLNRLISGIDDRNVNRIPACQTCEWRHACRGGCSLETYEAFHTLDRESGICSFYKGMYPFLFEKLISDPEFVGQHMLQDVTLIELVHDPLPQVNGIGVAV
jgi:radical SAM protein with 4Fe4S-binding SPASM domain